MQWEASCDAVAGPQHWALPAATLPYQLRTSSLTSVALMISLISIFREICLTGSVPSNIYSIIVET
jgi:hypothetical protein